MTRIGGVMRVSDDGQRAIVVSPANAQSWDCYVRRADGWSFAGLSCSGALAEKWLRGEALE